jgi:hypothetical protein
VDAASHAANLTRMLDRAHLEQAVTHTDQGPAVLWSDIVRVMPLATDKPTDSDSGAR